MIKQLERIKIDKHTKEFLIAVINSDLPTKYKKQIIDLWVMPKWFITEDGEVNYD